MANRRALNFAAGANVTEAIRTDIVPAAELGRETRTLLVRLLTGSWTSAEIGIKVSWDGVNYYPWYDDVANDYPGVAAPDALVYRSFTVPVVRYMKLWSNDGSGTATNQVNAITLEALIA